MSCASSAQIFGGKNKNLNTPNLGFLCLFVTADFRMVVQKVNGKWRDIIANGSTVQ